MRKLMNDLSTLREKDIIRDIDVEICRLFAEEYEDISDDALLAVCLTSHLYGRGDVCLPLEQYASESLFNETDEDHSIPVPDLDSWLHELRNSPIVGNPGDFKPLILDEAGRLYFHKLWQYENRLAEQLVKRGEQDTEDISLELLQDGLERLFEDTSEHPDWQKIAAATAVKKKFSVISGGPGTGKTSTVVRILALLLEQASKREASLNIALAAPTGKAAARLKNSILSAKNELNIADDIRAAIPDKAITLHQLLGARRHTSVFKHNKENPVPYDVVIVDEASMVDQALMSKLMVALLEDTKVILLGDKDQLASVEAGSVLGDICDLDMNNVSQGMANWLAEISLDIPQENIAADPKSLIDNITLLTKSYRFDEDSGIAQLAASVNRGASESAINVLSSNDYEGASLVSIEDQDALDSVLEQKLTGYIQKIIESDSPEQALDYFGDFQMLAAHRRGPWGIEYLNQLAEQLLQRQGLIPKYDRWYVGKPVIVDVNDYTLDLRNGDTGICLRDEAGDLKIYFRHEDSVRSVVPGRLPDHSMAYALTVHKSQGSEFDEVLLVLPNHRSKVLSRELIYTAITRARTSISILGQQSVLQYSINTQLRRSSGLRDHLWT
ncbi:DNA helicase/exodeoxyribonuclease V, alpha subunit [Fodinibius salinus]|uniref:DNA helicase/exodeoxyribonuclease V, alpha subunit n=2 Tax=Fodinibius salinus TaxID=860790 RepID=A0A5D3YNH9_9BACT|nr:DNA helicase/exodeoxyribonuclease V, alpha subunit [Fodinibius salinus]